jgi:hypothetical protein
VGEFEEQTPQHEARLLRELHGWFAYRPHRVRPGRAGWSGGPTDPDEEPLLVPPGWEEEAP